MALHDLSFAGTFVIDAAEMKQSVDYHAVKLGHVISADSFSIGAHGIERYKHIATHASATGIVEGDYVSVIVMLQVLPVDLYYLVVVTEDVSQRSVSPRGATYPHGCSRQQVIPRRHTAIVSLFPYLLIRLLTKVTFFSEKLNFRSSAIFLSLGPKLSKTALSPIFQPFIQILSH